MYRSLINELLRYSKNEKLFGLLSNFNGHKKKAGHKLYETNDDANAVNEKLREYVKTHPVGNILDAIRAEHAMLQKRLQDRLIDFGCTTSGVDTKTIRKRYEEENKSTPDGI